MSQPNSWSVLAVLFGSAGLLLFGWFAVIGPPALVTLPFTSDAQRLAWDAFLSLIFFLQHSGMVRRAVSARVTKFIPDQRYGAFYAAASGIVLSVVVLLWQPCRAVVYDLRAVWLPWGIAAAAAAGGIWSVHALGGFDLFGLDARRHDRLTIRGPYRYTRHPLYLLTIVLIWCQPQVTIDRLLFNLLFTAWIVVAARLEERDLVARFGEAYRRYQEQVPMLIPLPRPKR